MSQSVAHEGTGHLVAPNISFRGPQELWAEWTPDAASTGVAG